MAINNYIFAIITLLIAFPSYAINIAPPAPSTEKLQHTDISSAVTDFELREAVSLLNAGKRDEANLKIAQILIKRPTDKNALELAGITLLQMKKFSAAEESFRRLVSLPPVKPSVVTNYGVAKILNGDIPGGAKLLEQVVKYTPNDAVAIRYLAWVGSYYGQTEAVIYYLEKLPEPAQAGLKEYHVELAKSYDAKTDYSAVVNLLSPVLTELGDNASPIETHAALYLSAAYAALNQPENANRLADSMVKYIKDDPAKLFLLKIRMSVMDKSPDAANKLVDDYITSFPGGEAFARYELARVRLHQKDTVSAIEQLDIVLSKVNENEVIGILRVMLPLMFGESMYSQAVGILNRESQKYPNNIVIKYNLAEAQSSAGRKAEAITTLKQMIERESTYMPAYLLAGSIARELGEPKDSLQYLSVFTKQVPQNIHGWTMFAGAYYDQGLHQKAIGRLKEGMEHNPDNARLHFELGSIYQSIGNLNRANEAYRKVIELDENNIGAMDNLASNLLDSNEELDIAKAIAARAYRDFPEDPYIQDLWGWALLRTGEPNKALPILKDAAKKITNTGRANYHLGLAMQQMSLKQDADIEFKLALEKGVDVKTQKDIESRLN